MRYFPKAVLLTVLWVCSASMGRGQIFDNFCPSGTTPIIPTRTQVLATGHLNDTMCYDANGNLIFPALGASLSASDTFTRANGALGPNWTTPTGSFAITSNAAQPVTSTISSAFWSGTNLVSNSQFSQVTIAAIGAGFPGASVFVSNVGDTRYSCFESTTTIVIQRRLAGALNNLTTAGTTGVAGDVLRLEINSSGNLTCYKNGISTLTVTDTNIKSGSPGIHSDNTTSTLNNWSGGNLPVSLGTGPTITQPLITTSSNTVYIGGILPQIGTSSDIGAQINAAYAAAPTYGQKAILLQKTGGGCYDYSVPIVLASAGKYFPLEGIYLGVLPSAPVLEQGSCLNFVPSTSLTTTAAAVASNVATLTFGSNPITFGFLVGEAINVSGFTGGDTYFNGQFSISSVTSTTITFGLVHANASAGTNGIVPHTALTIDYTPVNGGGFGPSSPLQNIALKNNSCNNTVGGCGSPTTGILFGPNGGIAQGRIQNVKVAGFGTALVWNAQPSWGMIFDNLQLVFNGTGLLLSAPALAESLKFDHGNITENATGVLCQSSTDIQFNAMSFDGNSTVAINNQACQITFVEPHFENPTGSTAAFYITQSNGGFVIEGGQIMEDILSAGTTPQLITTTGGFFDVRGINVVAGAGSRVVTNFINNTAGGQGNVSYFLSSVYDANFAPDVAGVPSTCSTAYTCSVERIGTTATTKSQQLVFPSIRFPFNGAGSPAGTASTAIMFFNGSLNRLNLENNGEAADNVNGTRNVLTAASTDTLSNKINTTFGTATNCSSSAAPAVCGSAAAGSFVVAAAASTVTVNTTAVTANSQIFIEEDDSLGTKLSVTCNTAASPPGLRISARVPATSFTVTVSAAPVTNPECYSYLIVN